METQDQSATQTPQVEGAMIRRAIVGGSVGNFVEWFDYSTYGYLAVTLGVVFFPFDSPTLSVLASLAVFGVAFVARPFGRFFFGPLGDKIGRQRTLAAVIILMSGATFLTGFLPGYATIGILAPILLIAARLLQGFSAGGEFGGAAAFLAEYSPDNRRGFLVSWLEFSTFAGLAMGSATVLLVRETARVPLQQT
jgi:MHS family proline/betaine transporter-like MFS transporter